MSAGRGTYMANTTLIWQHEHFSGKIRFQRGFLVVVAQDTILPGEQVGILPSEVFPVGSLRANHALADHEEIGAGDGFVVELGLAAGSGESLQGAGKLL